MVSQSNCSVVVVVQHHKQTCVVGSIPEVAGPHKSSSALASSGRGNCQREVGEMVRSKLLLIGVSSPMERE